MAEDRMAVLDTVRKAINDGDIDFLREGVRVLAQAVMEVEVTERTGAAKGERNPDARLTHRNGYRDRRWDTRVGTIDVAIPKLRSGTYFPEWLLERRKRAESALITVVADCYLAGVSTRRMDRLVKQLGIDSLSKSQVSQMATDLDTIVEEFRHRPLDAAGPFTFVAADALTMKVREGGRVVNSTGNSTRVPSPIGIFGSGNHRSHWTWSPGW